MLLGVGRLTETDLDGSICKRRPHALEYNLSGFRLEVLFFDSGGFI
jgi:hypothetical protein